MKLKLLNKAEIITATKNHDVQKLTKIINNFQKKTDQQSSHNKELSTEINFIDDTGSPLLHYAIVSPDDYETKRVERSFECFKILLCCNVDINLQDGRKQQTPLHVAARKGNLPIVDLLLTQPGIRIDQRDSSGNTPLMLAAENNNLEVVKMLFKSNADVHTKNQMNQSALDLAASRDAKNVINFLLPKVNEILTQKYCQRPKIEMRNSSSHLQCSNSSYSLNNNNSNKGSNQKLFDIHNPTLPSNDLSKRPTSFSLFFEKHRNYMRSSSVAPTIKYNSGVMTSSYDASGFSDGKNESLKDNNSASLEDITLCDKKYSMSKKNRSSTFQLTPTQRNCSLKMPDLTLPQLPNQWTQSYSSVNLNRTPNLTTRQQHVQNQSGNFVPHSLHQHNQPQSTLHHVQQASNHLQYRHAHQHSNPNFFTGLSSSPSRSQYTQQNCYQHFQPPPPPQPMSLSTPKINNQLNLQRGNSTGVNVQRKDEHANLPQRTDSSFRINQDIILQRSRDNSHVHHHHNVTPKDFVPSPKINYDKNFNGALRVHQQSTDLSSYNELQNRPDPNATAQSSSNYQLLNQTKQLNISNSSNRNSAASLDSGRGSECTNSDITRNNSGQTTSPNQSEILNGSGSSSSSSSYSSSSPSKILNTSDLIGLPQPMTKINEVDMLYQWICSINLEKYFNLISEAGYDLATLTKATSDDLITVGVTNPRDRQLLRKELGQLSMQPLPACFTTNMPKDLSQWLQSLGLHDQYWKVFQTNQIHSLHQISLINWEDLQDMGITKLGHQKKLILAIEYMNKVIKLGSFNINDQATCQKNSSPNQNGPASPTLRDKCRQNCLTKSIIANDKGQSPAPQFPYPQIVDSHLVVEPTNPTEDKNKKSSFEMATNFPRLPPKQFQDESKNESSRESFDKDNLFNKEDLTVLQNSLLPLPYTKSSRITDEIQDDMENVLRVLRETMPPE